MKATSTEGKAHNYTSKEAMTVFIDKLTEIHDAKDSGGIGLKTGINDLDNVLGGLQPSDMTIVGARPGVGKTAFAISILHSLAKKGKRVGFFSTEMAVFQVMGRLASLEGNIPAAKLRHADLDDLDFARLSNATNSITGMDFRICDKPAITVGELAMQARAWQADGGIDFIAVDYLTRLHPDKPSQNQVQDVGNIATALKNLARNLNIPVMVLAQLNRGSTNRADKTPVMSDLRDSGVIEQEADQIIMLYRPEEGAAEVIVDKNRHGECGVVRCIFEPNTMHWKQFGE
jgi:replicative DNA helicase